MTSSVFAWRQTSPLFMPEEQKRPQSPSAIPCYLDSAPAIESPTVDQSCSLRAREPLDLCGGTELSGENSQAQCTFVSHLMITHLNCGTLTPTRVLLNCNCNNQRKSNQSQCTQFCNFVMSQQLFHKFDPSSQFPVSFTNHRSPPCEHVYVTKFSHPVSGCGNVADGHLPLAFTSKNDLQVFKDHARQFQDALHKSGGNQFCCLSVKLQWTTNTQQ